MLLLGLDGGRGKLHVVAMDVVFIHAAGAGDAGTAAFCQSGHHRQTASFVDGNLVCQAQIFNDPQGVLGGEFQTPVAVYRANAQQVQILGQCGQHNGNRVIRTGIHIQNNFLLFHVHNLFLLLVDRLSGLLFMTDTVDVKSDQNRRVGQHIGDLIGNVKLL